MWSQAPLQDSHALSSTDLITYETIKWSLLRFSLLRDRRVHRSIKDWHRSLQVNTKGKAIVVRLQIKLKIKFNNPFQILTTVYFITWVTWILSVNKDTTTITYTWPPQTSTLI